MMFRRIWVNLNNMGLICVGIDTSVNENYFKISDLLIVEIDSGLFPLSVLCYFHLPLQNYSIDTRVF